MKLIPQEGELTQLRNVLFIREPNHQTKNAGFLIQNTTLLFLHSWDRRDDGY